MSNTFNIKRFSWLFRKTLLERPMQIIGFTGLSLAVTLILYVIGKYLSGFNVAQNGSFIWGLPLGSCLLASIVFGYFSSNASGSSFLTLPASAFEKWFCAILIAGVLYPVVFLLLYRLMDSSFVAIYHQRLDPSSLFYKEQYESVYIFDFNGAVAWKVYPSFFLLTGAMLVGSLYFNKIPFIKTAIGICILVIGFVGLNWIVAKAMFGDINDAGLFNYVSIPVGKEDGLIELPENFLHAFYYSQWYIIPAILWLLSFTRLREKEF